MIELTSVVRYYRFSTVLMTVNYKQTDYLTLNNFKFSSTSAFAIKSFILAYLKSLENSFAFTTDFTIAFHISQIKLEIELKSLLILQKKMNPSKIKKIIVHSIKNFEISFTFTKLMNFCQMSYNMRITIMPKINLLINYQNYYQNRYFTFRLMKTNSIQLIILFSNQTAFRLNLP